MFVRRWFTERSTWVAVSQCTALSDRGDPFPCNMCGCYYLEDMESRPPLNIIPGRWFHNALLYQINATLSHIHCIVITTCKTGEAGRHCISYLGDGLNSTWLYQINATLSHVHCIVLTTWKTMKAGRHWLPYLATDVFEDEGLLFAPGFGMAFELGDGPVGHRRR